MTAGVVGDEQMGPAPGTCGGGMDADARAGLSALQAKPTDLANRLPAGSLGKLPTTQPRCASTSSLTRQIPLHSASRFAGHVFLPRRSTPVAHGRDP